MIFERVLLDNESFRVVGGILGGIVVTAKNFGIKRRVSLQERSYLARMITALNKRGIAISPGCTALESLLDDFANSVAGRGGDMWRVFFTMQSPEEHANYYVD